MQHDLTTHEIPIDELALLQGNPRHGDIGAVSESIRTNGFYQPIVVNKGTKTGRPMEILAGNHRAQAAKALGHKTVTAVLLDVDNDRATAIALADNRTSDLASYDTDALVLMLQSLPDLAGTGYDGDDLDDLMNSLKQPGEDEWGEALGALPTDDPTVLTRTFSLTREQADIVDKAVQNAITELGDTITGNRNGAALAHALRKS